MLKLKSYLLFHMSSSKVVSCRNSIILVKFREKGRKCRKYSYDKVSVLLLSFFAVVVGQVKCRILVRKAFTGVYWGHWHAKKLFLNAMRIFNSFLELQSVEASKRGCKAVFPAAALTAAAPAAAIALAAKGVGCMHLMEEPRRPYLGRNMHTRILEYWLINYVVFCHIVAQLLRYLDPWNYVLLCQHTFQFTLYFFKSLN